ncbi:hypothetical protein [Lysobacter sp. GCM10012299]|uniref:hypothetical protein n=1 Tax=Lysobacter sp. GCM10012299 TaxID=3317333 RepID=UPI00361BC443
MNRKVVTIILFSGMQSAAAFLAVTYLSYFLGAEAYEPIAWRLVIFQIAALGLDLGLNSLALRLLARTGSAGATRSVLQIKFTILAALGLVAAILLPFGGWSLLPVLAGALQSFSVSARVLWAGEKRLVDALPGIAMLCSAAVLVPASSLVDGADAKFAMAFLLPHVVQAITFALVCRVGMSPASLLRLKGIRFGEWLGVFVSGIGFAMAPQILALIAKDSNKSYFVELSLALSLSAAPALLLNSYRLAKYVDVSGRTSSLVAAAERLKVVLADLRNFAVIYFSAVVAMTIGAMVVYSGRYGDMPLALLVICLGTFSVFTVGLINVKAQVDGMVVADALVNVLRVALAALLALVIDHLLILLICYYTMMVCGEMLIATVRRNV